MKVKIYRFNPDIDEKERYDEYTVPMESNGEYTVMDVLDYIYNKLDSTLSYYSHSVCNQGICVRCSAKINNKVGLTCTYRIYEEELLIEPKNNKIIKDLIVN